MVVLFRMNTRILNIPPEDIGNIIGRQYRNMFFINQIIAPGKINIKGERVELYGELENKLWLSRTIRILRSARRGGILKWFQLGHDLPFQHDENWLCQIRAMEGRTKTFVHQQNVVFKKVSYEVWLVLERDKTANIEGAIRSIGQIIHKRYHRRALTKDFHHESKQQIITNEKREKKRYSKMKSLRMKERRSRKQRHRYEKDKTIGLV